jgi:thiol-disulfide isomerase/thioredoxin
MNINKLKDVGIEVSDNLQEGRVIIDVFTTWCGPCNC